MPHSETSVGSLSNLQDTVGCYQGVAMGKKERRTEENTIQQTECFIKNSETNVLKTWQLKSVKFLIR